MWQFIARHRRKIEFLFVGGIVTILSFVQLWFMIDVLGANYWVAYAIQTVISVELNFFGNYLIGWRDKRQSISVWKAHGVFWLTRLVMVLVNPVLFAILTELGVAYLLAQLVIVVANTILNYIAADKLAFGERLAGRKPQQESDTDSVHGTHCRGFDEVMPFVSVVVPVKDRQATIRELVDSYLRQDYDGKSELILVGDAGDTTWQAIQDYIQSGEVRAVEAVVASHDRDANAKRNVGLEVALGDVLVLTDSDVILPPTWISHGISLMQKGDGYHVVAGSLRSISEDGFWSSYIDENTMGSKTPRMTPAYVLTKENCGKGRFKQPITASMFLDRQAYEEVGGLDADFVTPYEDYPYADEIVRAGYEILCDGDLVAYHYHRESFRSLTKEYWRAGYGCADYVLRYAYSHLAASRARQLLAIGFAACVAICMSVVSPWLATGVAMLGLFGLSGISVAKVKKARAALFPWVTLFLGGVFAAGMMYGFARRYWFDQPPTAVKVVYEKSASQGVVRVKEVNL